MLSEPPLGANALSAYADKIGDLGDEEYVAEAAEQILAARHEPRYGAADQRIGALYREAVLRGGLPLYQRGYAIAAERAGIATGADDRRLARAA